MLKTERERKICKKYSQRDENGLVRCHECPLRIKDDLDWSRLCKVNASYNKSTKEWEPDEPYQTTILGVEVEARGLDDDQELLMYVQLGLKRFGAKLKRMVVELHSPFEEVEIHCEIEAQSFRHKRIPVVW